MTDEQQVAHLLTASIQAHEAAIVARRTRAANARELLFKARDLRLQADALDPERLAPAWTSEQGKTPKHKDTHQALLNFYAQQIGL